MKNLKKTKNRWNRRWKKKQKMSKAIKENKLTVTIKRLLWEFILEVYVYRQSK